MKKYAFELQVQQTFDAPVSRHSFLLRCLPGTYPFQRSYAHKFTIKPYAAITTISDVFGNEMYTGTIDKAHNSFSFKVSGFVLASRYLSHDPLDRLYLYPTRCTPPTDGMRLLIHNSDLPANEWARAKLLCRKTASLLVLDDRDGCRNSAEVFAAGKGNAAEITQVFLALCRLSGIAARCVSGLAPGHNGTHTWAEVYCDHVWRALDPSAGTVIEQGYLKIAHGPDNDNCCMERSCYRAPDTGSTRITSASVTEHIILTRDTVPHA